MRWGRKGLTSPNPSFLWRFRLFLSLLFLCFGCVLLILLCFFFCLFLFCCWSVLRIVLFVCFEGGVFIVCFALFFVFVGVV